MVNSWTMSWTANEKRTFPTVTYTKKLELYYVNKMKQFTELLVVLLLLLYRKVIHPKGYKHLAYAGTQIWLAHFEVYNESMKKSHSKLHKFSVMSLLIHTVILEYFNIKE